MTGWETVYRQGGKGRCGIEKHREGEMKKGDIKKRRGDSERMASLSIEQSRLFVLDTRRVWLD